MPNLTFVGLGPGQADLLSSRAHACLKEADAILLGPGIDAQWLQDEVAIVDACWPVEPTSTGEDEARARMLQWAREGKKVVRARPGRGWGDVESLRDMRVLHANGIAFNVVPGVAQDACAWQSWLQDHKLFGRRVVVTRMRDQASETAELLKAKGADPYVMPTIELHAPSDPLPLQQACDNLGSYDVVAFTSANGVEMFFDVLDARRRDARAFAGVRVASIGTGTARALQQRGIRADVVAKDFRGEGLAAAILEAKSDQAKCRVLIPRAKEAREVLPEMLRAAGCEVDVVAVYETHKPARETAAQVLGLIERGQVDAVLLTSSSTVQNLCDLVGADYREVLSKMTLASIGPITTQTAQSLDLRVDVEAAVFTVPGLVEALEKHFDAGDKNDDQEKRLPLCQADEILGARDDKVALEGADEHGQRRES